jgi:hypothetical protein
MNAKQEEEATMGMQTEMAIKEWQKNAGLHVPSPAIHELWCELQQTAFAAIKIAELEKSGIRDGDSGWHGGDVIGGTLQNLQDVCARLWAAYDAETYKPTAEERGRFDRLFT